jgi:hypothetical protein
MTKTCDYIGKFSRHQYKRNTIFYSTGDQPFVNRGHILLKIPRLFTIVPDIIFKGGLKTLQLLLREFAPFLVVKVGGVKPH